MSRETHLPFLHGLPLDPKKDNSKRIRIDYEVLRVCMDVRFESNYVILNN